MADAFAPQFGGEVRFNQPIETPTGPSTGEALLGLAGGFLKAFGNAEEDRRRQTQANAPSSADLQRQADVENLSKYTKRISELQQERESGSISESAFRINVGQLNASFAGLGIDVSGAEYDNVRTSLTGLPSTSVTMTPDQMAYNDLTSTVEGQAEYALAEAAVIAENGGKDPTLEQVIARVKNEQAKKIEFDQLTVKTELDLKRELPKFQSQVVAIGDQLKGAISIIEQNGLRIDDPEMIQNSYLGYQARRAEIVNKIPVGVANRDQIIKDLFSPIDEFFSGLGIEEGKFTRLTQGQLDIKRKGILAVELLNKESNAAASVLALGIMKKDYNMDEAQFLTLQGILGDVELTPSTPEWIPEAGIVVTNDMITVASQLSSLNAEFLKSYDGTTEALKGVMGEEVWNNWTSRTDAENWKEFQSRAKIFGGFSAEAMRNGQVPPDVVFTNLGGMAASFGSINTAEEAISFAGVRDSVSAQLPAVVANLEAVDPEKGKAARTMLWLSIGKAARGFEAQITTSESANGLVFNPKTRTYNINTATLAPDDAEGAWFAGVVQRRYGGDVVKAISDNFSRLTPEDAPEGATFAGGDSIVGRLQAKAQDLAPDVDEVKRTLDLRNSFVYLDNLGRQLEPEEARVAREVLNKPLSEVSQADVLGGAAMETLSTTPRPGEITQTTIPAASGYRIPEEVAKDTEFVSAAGRLATDLNLPVDDIFRVIEFETAGSWSPSIKNPGSTATGLIQFLESTAKGLGTTTADLAGMTRGQQMEYVRRYLEPYKGRIKNFGDLYMAIHYPKAVGQSETFVMYSQGSAEYAANKNLDTNGDGTVTRGETVASVIARTGGGRGVMTTPATAQTEAFVEQAQADISTAAPPGGFAPAATTVSMNPPAEAAPAAPVTSMAPPAEAALPDDIPQETQPSRASQEEAARNAPPVDSEVAALIQEIAGGPDKTYASERELLAAQQRGELEPGDTIIVDGVAYMVRRDGTPKRLGVVQQ